MPRETHFSFVRFVHSISLTNFPLRFFFLFSNKQKRENDAIGAPKRKIMKFSAKEEAR